MKYLRRDVAIINSEDKPTDRNDQAAAETAVELTLPAGFSEKAKAFWNYLEGSAFIYEYKDKLVVTDESLELSEDGSLGPRWTFETWDEMEKTLEAEEDAR